METTALHLARRLDLRLLSSLEILLETRSVSRAADRLGVSQPAMSRILARLRDQLDDPLLVRGRGGMVLTPRAEALAGPLKGWLSQGEAMLRPAAFDPASLDRTFRIASTDFGILSVIRPVAPALAEAARGASMEIEALSANSLRRLAEGRLDLVVIGYPPEGNGVRFRKLFTESRLGLMRRGHPASAVALTPDNLFDWPHVTALVGNGFTDPLEHLAGEGQGRKVLMAAPSFASVPFMVADTDALAILPSKAARHFAKVYDLDTFEPPIPLPTFDYYVAWHDRSLADGATQWLAEEMADAVAAFEERGRHAVVQPPRMPAAPPPIGLLAAAAR